MANQNYNRLTLSPHDKGDKKLFNDFRLNEMCVQYKLIMGVACISWIFKTYNLIFLDDSVAASKQEFLFVSFALVSVLITYRAGLRWKWLFPYLLVMQVLGI